MTPLMTSFHAGNEHLVIEFLFIPNFVCFACVNNFVSIDVAVNFKPYGHP